MDRDQVIAQIAQRYTSACKYSGVEWLVEHHGELMSSGRVGYADAHAGSDIPERAIYRIYSMTKPIVSVLALMLIEEGRLRLYDALSSYDKRFVRMQVLSSDGTLKPAERAILVEDLLTHRAGFSYEFITGCHIAPMYLDAQISGDGRCSLNEMMSRLAQLPLAFQPGSRFRYSVATDVLAHLIECVTGEQIDALLRKQLFAPLGMNETAFYVDAANRERLMPMFGCTDISEFAPLAPRPHELTPADVEDMYPSDSRDFRRGGHGLYSTSADYLRFARLLLDGRDGDGGTLLSRKMLEMMRSNRIPAAQLPLSIGMLQLPGYGWGLGVRVMMDTGQAMSLTGLGELGWAGAADTYFFVDPGEELTGVFMTQYLGGVLPLHDDLRTAVYQMLP